ncbi:MAG: tetratricopeptide repeat protein [Myxococcales bacterium]|nr:tetratricopeptide repeat protein [Myxococcales bacterium]
MSPPWALAFWVIGCSDPALIHLRDAARQYDQGRAAYATGDHASAAESFSRARAIHTRSATLALWDGRALAAAGRLDEAVRAADDAIALDPTSGVAHYNRGAWLARANRLDDAAPALEKALFLQASTAWDAATDPDFAPHRHAPAFAGILPAEDFTARMTGPPGSSFVGSEIELEFSLTGPPGRALALTGPSLPGCLRQTRLIEDTSETRPGTLTRTLHARFRADAPCAVLLGPFEVRGGATALTLPAVPITVLGPDGGTTEPGLEHPAVWLLPGSIDGEAPVPGWPGAIARMGVGVGDSEHPEHAPTVQLELRYDHQTRVMGGVRAPK